MAATATIAITLKCDHCPAVHTFYVAPAVDMVKEAARKANAAGWRATQAYNMLCPACKLRFAGTADCWPDSAI